MRTEGRGRLARWHARAGLLRGIRSPVVFDAGRDGLAIRAYDPEVAVMYHQAGKTVDGPGAMPALSEAGDVSLPMLS